MGFIRLYTLMTCLALTVVAQQQRRDPCRQNEAEGRGCAPGQECRLVQTGCTTCPPEPVCTQPRLRVSSCRYGDPVLARNLSVLSCTSDRDCPSQTTCNFEVMDTQTTCCWTPREVTPPVLTNPCIAALCQEGYYCENREVSCDVPPCRREAVCVRDPTLTGKSGECPRVTGPGICITECETDFDCNGNQKCCSNGCGNVCTAPTATVPTVPSPPSDPCATIRCASGLKCQVQKVQCFSAPCDPIVSCVGDPTLTGKSGECPRVTGPGICITECETDFDCNGNKKCCSNGCGNVCTAPTAAVPTVPSPPSDPCATIRCASGLKCQVQKVQCFSAPCDPIVSCVGDPTLTGKSGECPRVTGPGICITECETDFDCNGNQKCCSNGCGNVCSAPTATVATVPTPPSDPCATIRCASGLKCQVQKVQCFSAPCDPIVSCVGPAPTTPVPVPTATRPGRCPHRFPIMWFLCDIFLHHCNTDNDCTSGALCCFASGCNRRACLHPELYRDIGGWY